MLTSVLMASVTGWGADGGVDSGVSRESVESGAVDVADRGSFFFDGSPADVADDQSVMSASSCTTEELIRKAADFCGFPPAATEASSRVLQPVSTDTTSSCRACDEPFLCSQRPSGFCPACQTAARSSDGYLCASCFKTHMKGFFPGHEALPWTDPSVDLLARLDCVAAPAQCTAHPSRAVEFKCLACPRHPLLCPSCLPVHSAHGVALLSTYAVQERARLLTRLAGLVDDARGRGH
jgi:hypothetical protein